MVVVYIFSIITSTPLSTTTLCVIQHSRLYNKSNWLYYAIPIKSAFEYGSSINKISPASLQCGREMLQPREIPTLKRAVTFAVDLRQNKIHFLLSVSWRWLWLTHTLGRGQINWIEPEGWNNSCKALQSCAITERVCDPIFHTESFRCRCF